MTLYRILPIQNFLSRFTGGGGIVNQWLSAYVTDMKFPETSGAEHLQMLQTRDHIATMEASLSSADLDQLQEADRDLIENAALIHAELARFIDLDSYRTEHHIEPVRWWWYLDVIQQLPLENHPPRSPLSVITP